MLFIKIFTIIKKKSVFYAILKSVVYKAYPKAPWTHSFLIENRIKEQNGKSTPGYYFYYLRNSLILKSVVYRVVNFSLITCPSIRNLLLFVVFFFQLDLRGDPYGLLAAHPLAPLVSLHHIDQLNSLFPNQTQIHSLKKLMSAYNLDPARIVQQSLCYDHKRRWSISISWGYTIQIYKTMLSAADLQMPMQTFQTWRTWSDGPFTFNTRHMSSDPCQQPAMFFLDQVKMVGTRGSITSYKRYAAKGANECKRADVNNVEVQRIRVSALKLDPEYWKNVYLSLSHTHAHTNTHTDTQHKSTKTIVLLLSLS